jgi:hypothetical protein
MQLILLQEILKKKSASTSFIGGYKKHADRYIKPILLKTGSGKSIR